MLRKVEIVVALLGCVGIVLLPIGAQNREQDRIVSSCRNLGSVEIGDVVLKCKEKKAKVEP